MVNPCKSATCQLALRFWICSCMAVTGFHVAGVGKRNSNGKNLPLNVARVLGGSYRVTSCVSRVIPLKPGFICLYMFIYVYICLYICLYMFIYVYMFMTSVPILISRQVQHLLNPFLLHPIIYSCPIVHLTLNHDIIT